MRFLTPSCSMNAMTFCCAPSPMESIATTAATPKIMPSIVRSERSLWLERFSKPSRRSGSHCTRARASGMTSEVLISRASSLRGRSICASTYRRPRRFVRFGFLCRSRFWIHKSNDRSRGNAGKNGAPFTQRAHLHFLRFKSALPFAVDNLFPFALEHRSARNGNGFRKLVAADAQSNGEARSQPRILALKNNSNVEFMFRIVIPELVRSRSPNALHFATEFLAGQRGNLDSRSLALLDQRTLGLA